MESRMPDDTTSAAGEGSAEVHSRISTTPVEFTPESGTPVEFSPDAGFGASESQSTLDRAKNKAQGVAGQARDRAQQAGQKAGDVASQAREKAGEALNQAQQKLEESGALRIVQDNPLPALGLAVGLGFLLAGSGDDDKGKRGGVYKAKQQLKGAVMGGLSAAVAQEARSVLGMGGGRGQQRSGSGNQQPTSRPPSHQEMMR